MKRFTFRLQTVLEHWVHTEEAERLKLARLVSERRRMEGAAAAIEESIRTTRDRWRRQREIFPSEIRLYGNYLAHLENKLTRLASQFAGLDEMIREQGKILTEAARQHRLLDHLRSRKWKQYLRELDRAEQKQMDDLYLGRISRDRAARG